MLTDSFIPFDPVIPVIPLSHYSMKFRAAVFFFVVGAIGAAATSGANDVTMDTGQKGASDVNEVVHQVLQGKSLNIDILQPVEREAVIRSLKDHIHPQDEPDSSEALAIGKALADLHAENYLGHLISMLTETGGGAADAERGAAFRALSFVKTKASVRVVAGFLSDDSFRREFKAYEKLAPNEREKYLSGHLVFMQRVRGTNLDNIANAIVSLYRMKITGAPNVDPKTAAMNDADVQTWQLWWEASKGSFEVDGPL